MVKRKKLIIASAVVGSIVLATIIGFAVKSCCCSKGSSKSPKSEDSSPINFENNAGTLDEEIFGEGQSGFCPKRARPSDSGHVENSDVPQSESKGVLKDVVFGKDGVKKVLVIDNPEEYIENILSCAEMPNPLLDGCYLKTLKYFKSPRLDESFTIENCSLLIACLAFKSAEKEGDFRTATKLNEIMKGFSKYIQKYETHPSFTDSLPKIKNFSETVLENLTEENISEEKVEIGPEFIIPRLDPHESSCSSQSLVKKDSEDLENELPLACPKVERSQILELAGKKLLSFFDFDFETSPVPKTKTLHFFTMTNHSHWTKSEVYKPLLLKYVSSFDKPIANPITFNVEENFKIKFTYPLEMPRLDELLVTNRVDFWNEIFETYGCELPIEQIIGNAAVCQIRGLTTGIRSANPTSFKNGIEKSISSGLESYLKRTSANLLFENQFLFPKTEGLDSNDLCAKRYFGVLLSETTMSICDFIRSIDPNVQLDDCYTQLAQFRAARDEKILHIYHDFKIERLQVNTKSIEHENLIPIFPFLQIEKNGKTHSLINELTIQNTFCCFLIQLAEDGTASKIHLDYEIIDSLLDVIAENDIFKVRISSIESIGFYHSDNNGGSLHCIQIEIESKTFKFPQIHAEESQLTFYQVPIDPCSAFLGLSKFKNFVNVMVVNLEESK